MKNFVLLSAIAAISASSAFQWPTEKIYNSWHETKLERWLKDHNIPYPAASDRKALADTVEKHWDAITPPYEQWSESQLRSWLVESGREAADLAASTKDDLVNLVTGSYADNSHSSLANWILDSWTDSQLKSFLDYHNIPNPTPRNRDSLLQSARSAYSNMVSTGSSVYDSIFGSWTDSDLKAWCDAHGVPVPQGSTKESMLASLRKNTHSFSEQAKSWWAGESMFDAWSESKLKEVLDANGVPVPQGSKLNELRALARKNSKSLKNAAGDYYNAGANEAKKHGDKAYNAAADKASAAANDAKKQGNKAYDAAADKANSAANEAKKQGNKAYNAAADKADKAAAEAKKQGNKAYNAAADKANSAANEAKKQGNKAYNAAADKADEAAAEAKNQGNKAYDAAAGAAGKVKAKVGETYEDIKAKVVGGAEDAADAAESVKNKGTRAAANAADQATKSAGAAYAKASGDVAGNNLFNFWSDSRLKAFLDARGIPVPQNGKKDELVAAARKNAHAARTSAEDFEGWSTAQLQKFAKDAKIKLDKSAASSRDALIQQTQQGYNALAKKGGAAAKEAQKQYSNVQGYAFDTWSDSDLKAFLDSYGVPVPQGGKKDELLAAARKNAHYFSNGQLEPVHGSAFAQMASDGLSSLFDFVKRVSGLGAQKANEVAADAKRAADDVRAEL